MAFGAHKLILVVALLWQLPVGAQLLVSPQGGTARLLGRVTDTSGQPLPDVQVKLGNLTARTDASGTYVLERLYSAQWEVSFEQTGYQATTTRVWLYDGLTSAQDVRLSPPVVFQPQTLVGLVGVGSLPRTDIFAQRFAEDLVRLKGFPQVQPLTYFDRAKVEPIGRKMNHTLAEILDRDRPEPQRVSDFFRYLGVKALVVARTDMRINPAFSGNNSELKSRTRIELWRFNGDVLQIQVLAQESREETADARLNEVEANDILQIQVTKMASQISQRWQGKENPWVSYLGNSQAVPTPRQVNTIRVEIINN